MNLADNYRLTSVKKLEKIPTGIDAAVYRLSGKFKGRASVRRHVRH